MKKEVLLLIKKHTDTLIENTKTKPQETLEYKMSKQMETFSFNIPINLSEESKWSLAVTSFEATNSVFNKTDENNKFSISIPSHCISGDDEELVNKLNKLIDWRYENDIELHLEEVRRKGNQVKIGDKDYLLSDLDTRKIDLNKELKKIDYKDFEDMVYRMELRYDEIPDTLDVR